MPTLNLLPARVKYAQQRRRLFTRLAVIQAAVLALACLSAAAAHMAVDRAWRRSAALDIWLRDPRYAASDRLADELKAAAARLDTQAVLFAAFDPAPFDSAWLPAIRASLPDGVRLDYADIMGGRVTLACVTRDLRLAERHRLALARDGIFTGARFGAITLSEDGHYQYALYAGTE